MAERGLSVDHSTIARWGVALCAASAPAHAAPFSSDKRSWRVAGRWTCYVEQSIPKAAVWTLCLHRIGIEWPRGTSRSWHCGVQDTFVCE